LVPGELPARTSGATVPAAKMADGKTIGKWDGE
jgi:hypothetical protein